MLTVTSRIKGSKQQIVVALTRSVVAAAEHSSMHDIVQ